jgi:hypothetical protein
MIELGIGPVGLHRFVVVMLAFCVCVFDRESLRRFGADLGWVPGAIYLPLVTWAAGYPNSWNPVLTAPGGVVLTFALLDVVMHGSTLSACVAAVGVALAADRVARAHRLRVAAWREPGGAVSRPSESVRTGTACLELSQQLHGTSGE